MTQEGQNKDDGRPDVRFVSREFGKQLSECDAAAFRLLDAPEIRQEDVRHELETLCNSYRVRLFVAVQYIARTLRDFQGDEAGFLACANQLAPLYPGGADGPMVLRDVESFDTKGIEAIVEGLEADVRSGCTTDGHIIEIMSLLDRRKQHRLGLRLVSILPRPFHPLILSHALHLCACAQAVDTVRELIAQHGEIIGRDSWTLLAAAIALRNCSQRREAQNLLVGHPELLRQDATCLHLCSSLLLSDGKHGMVRQLLRDSPFLPGGDAQKGASGNPRLLHLYLESLLLSGTIDDAQIIDDMGQRGLTMKALWTRLAELAQFHVERAAWDVVYRATLPSLSFRSIPPGMQELRLRALIGQRRVGDILAIAEERGGQVAFRVAIAHALREAGYAEEAARVVSKVGRSGVPKNPDLAMEFLRCLTAARNFRLIQLSRGSFMRRLYGTSYEAEANALLASAVQEVGSDEAGSEKGGGKSA